MPVSVAVIDSGIGNLTSVHNALRRFAVPVAVTKDPSAIAAASHLILPGVGSFGEGMKELGERGLLPILCEEVLIKKKQILGICLGMQLFATEGFEHGHHRGLGFIAGTVRKIETSASGLRLPHIGWNNVRVSDRHPLSRGLANEPIFYFVHSYCFVPEDRGIIAGACDYGEEIVAMVQRGNICGVQFHPEKSDADGMRIFENFLDFPSC